MAKPLWPKKVSRVRVNLLEKVSRPLHLRLAGAVKGGTR
jgi:hypothetical protein